MKANGQTKDYFWRSNKKTISRKEKFSHEEFRNKENNHEECAKKDRSDSIPERCEVIRSLS
jgi:hypothetical protein